MRQFLTDTHLAAHTLIFVSYIVAALIVPQAFKQLMALRSVTMAAGAGFFVFCGVTHLGLAFDESKSWWVTGTDHVQALCIVAFIAFLTLDLYDASHRLSLAFEEIRDEFGPQTGGRVAAIIRVALTDESREA